MYKSSAKLNFALAVILVASCTAFAQAPAKKMTKDDVFRGIAAQVLTQSESPATSIIGALDEVIEVGDITFSAKDGKWLAVVKEKAPSTAASVNKEIPLMFAQQPDGTFKWEQFKNDAKFYPLEKLYPYAKDYLTRSRDGVGVGWKKYLAAMTALGDAAFKALDTAKAIIKKDPEPLAAVNTARESLKKAIESGDVDALKAAYRDLTRAVEPIAKLTDELPDLKTNDAYVRLAEATEAARKNLAAARTEYVNGVNQYNDRILRLPFTLVAFGFGFTKMEPQIEMEQ
ncbi:MAG TPA: LemA family protein [Blastocatellia bacterium]|nr:LemA family protein [Blastocatellia bacterium]